MNEIDASVGFCANETSNGGETDVANGDGIDDKTDAENLNANFLRRTSDSDEEGNLDGESNSCERKEKKVKPPDIFVSTCFPFYKK